MIKNNMEIMKKKYDTFGEGMLEICDNVWSLAQAFDQEEICQCESCLSWRGEEETQCLISEREKRLRTMTPDQLITFVVDRSKKDEEYEDYNGNWSEQTYRDGRLCNFTYCTGGELYMEVTPVRVWGGDEINYKFAIYREEGFREGSTLKETLSQLGFTSHIETE